MPDDDGMLSNYSVCCRWGAFANGFDVEVATDDVWSNKTTVQFATYVAIVFGDSNLLDTFGSGTSLFDLND